MPETEYLALLSLRFLFNEINFLLLNFGSKMWAEHFSFYPRYLSPVLKHIYISFFYIQTSPFSIFNKESTVHLHIFLKMEMLPLSHQTLFFLFQILPPYSLFIPFLSYPSFETIQLNTLITQILSA